MGCDMCGKDGELFSAHIEGTEMQVCRTCSQYGTSVRKIIIKKIAPKQKFEAQESIEIVMKDYAYKIRYAREKKMLTQEDFAKQLNVKLSHLQGMENGKIKPSVVLAKKLEKLLHIPLVDVLREEEFTQKQDKTEGFTFGDFIKK